MPVGKLKLAVEPVPSDEPGTLAVPAIVVTAPPGAILRTTWSL